MIVSTLPSGHDQAPSSSSSSPPPSLSAGSSAGAGGEEPSGEVNQDELLFAETALSLCGIRTNETMTKECWPLLSILRRKIKMSTAFIVDGNSNRHLFTNARGPGYHSFLVSYDILSDPRIKPKFMDHLRYGVRAYLGVSMIMLDGQIGTLMITANEPKKFSADDIYLACELSASMEERYQLRRTVAIANTIANLTISSVLLSSVKAHLQVTTEYAEKMKTLYRSITSSRRMISNNTFSFGGTTQMSVKGTTGPSLKSNKNSSESSHTSTNASMDTSVSRGTFLGMISRGIQMAASLATGGDSNASMNIGRSQSMNKSASKRLAANSHQQSGVSLALPASLYQPAPSMTVRHGFTTGEDEKSLWKEMTDLANHFQVVQQHTQDSVERALLVAQHYTARDKNSYYIKCFEAECVGIVESMNTALEGLSKLIPEHSLMWAFDLSAQLAHCPHRTFYSHLIFFLEGLVFRWAKFCSSAQIRISFETGSMIDYYSPRYGNVRHLVERERNKGNKNNRKQGTGLGVNVDNRMREVMLGQTIVSALSMDNFAIGARNIPNVHTMDSPRLDSKNTAATTLGGSRKPSHETIRADNVDSYTFNMTDMSDEKSGNKGDMTAGGSSSSASSPDKVVETNLSINTNLRGNTDDLNIVEIMNNAMQIDIGSIIRHAASPNRLNDPVAVPSILSSRSSSQSFDDRAGDDDNGLSVHADSPAQVSTPLPDEGMPSGVPSCDSRDSCCSGASIYGERKLNLNLSINTDVKPVVTNKGFIQHGYLRILFQPLDIMDSMGMLIAGSSHGSDRLQVRKPPIFPQNFSPLVNTGELMRVLGDFLYEIDPKAMIMVAPRHFMRRLPEPQSVAFMILLPCYFKLSNKEEISAAIEQNYAIERHTQQTEKQNVGSIKLSSLLAATSLGSTAATSTTGGVIPPGMTANIPLKRNSFNTKAIAKPPSPINVRTDLSAQVMEADPAASEPPNKVMSTVVEGENEDGLKCSQSSGSFAHLATSTRRPAAALPSSTITAPSQSTTSLRRQPSAGNLSQGGSSKKRLRKRKRSSKMNSGGNGLARQPSRVSMQQLPSSGNNSGVGMMASSTTTNSRSVFHSVIRFFTRRETRRNIPAIASSSPRTTNNTAMVNGNSASSHVGPAALSRSTLHPSSPYDSSVLDLRTVGPSQHDNQAHRKQLQRPAGGSRSLFTSMWSAIFRSNLVTPEPSSNLR